MIDNQRVVYWSSKPQPACPPACLRTYLVFVFLLAGVLTSWAAPACNNPIFAEVGVPPPHVPVRLQAWQGAWCVPPWLQQLYERAGTHVVPPMVHVHSGAHMPLCMCKPCLAGRRP